MSLLTFFAVFVILCLWGYALYRYIAAMSEVVALGADRNFNFKNIRGPLAGSSSVTRYSLLQDPFFVINLICGLYKRKVSDKEIKTWLNKARLWLFLQLPLLLVALLIVMLRPVG